MGCVLCCRSGCKEHLMVTNFMQICSRALICVSHKKGCASLLNSLLLPVPSSQGKHNCRSHLKPGALNPPLSVKPPDCLPSTEAGPVIQHCCDSSASLCWQIPAHGLRKPCQHIWETHPWSMGAELWRCWQTLPCSFHAFQRSLIVFDVPERHRMILSSCYPFFTTEFGLKIHTLVINRNLKLPLSTYCIRMRC